VAAWDRATTHRGSWRSLRSRKRHRPGPLRVAISRRGTAPLPVLFFRAAQSKSKRPSESSAGTDRKPIRVLSISEKEGAFFLLPARLGLPRERKFSSARATAVRLALETHGRRLSPPIAGHEHPKTLRQRYPLFCAVVASSVTPRSASAAGAIAWRSLVGCKARAGCRTFLSRRPSPPALPGPRRASGSFGRVRAPQLFSTQPQRIPLADGCSRAETCLSPVSL
jgi:hypothetical protein